MEEKFNEFLKVVVYPVFAYLGMDLETTLLLVILMLTDSVLGAVKSYRLGYKVKLSIFWWGISTKFIFILIPMTLAVVGKKIPIDFTASVNIIMIVMIISEAYSILGNVYAIRNKEEVEKIDAISLIIKKIRDWMKNKINFYINKIEENNGCKVEEKDQDK